MSKRLDPEIKALRAVERALRSLSIEQHDRILVWAVGSLVEDPRRSAEKACALYERDGTSRSHGPVTYAPTFALKLRDDDEPILREIVERIGIGRFARDAVRSGNSKPCATWHVDARNDCAMLAALLDRYPLRLARHGISRSGVEQSSGG